MITENLSTLKIHKLTKEQYNRELQAGNIDENALYLTPEEEIDLRPYATIEQLNTKADASTVNAALNQKVSRNDFETALDLKVSTSQIANNLTTTASGYVLDARQGKILDDTITSTATTLQNYSDGNLDLAKEYTDTEISDLETNKVNNSIKDLSVEGKVITFTKQDGTSSTITTQDTDKKVTQTVRTTNGAFPVLLRGTSAGTTTTTTTTTFATGITANPSTGKITAVGFVGDVTGNADTATQATQDSEGNVINTTYETKSNVTAQINAAKEYAAGLVNGLSTTVEQHTAKLNTLGSAADQDSEYFTNDAQTKATSAETAAKAYAKEYADGIKDDLLNGAGEAYDTLQELGVLIDENTDAIDALEIIAANKADKIHSHEATEISVNIPTGTLDEGTLDEMLMQIDDLLSQLAFDKTDKGHKHTLSDITNITASAVELNYSQGVTSNIQTQFDTLSQQMNSVKGEAVLISIPTTGWSYTSPYTIDIPVEGVSANQVPIFSLIAAGDEATEAEMDAVNLITDITTGDGFITVEVSDIPMIGFSIALYGLSNNIEYSPADYSALAGRVSALEAAPAPEVETAKFYSFDSGTISKSVAKETWTTLGDADYLSKLNLDANKDYIIIVNAIARNASSYTGMAQLAINEKNMRQFCGYFSGSYICANVTTMFRKSAVSSISFQMYLQAATTITQYRFEFTVIPI